MSDPVVRCSELQLTDGRRRVRARLSMLDDQPVFELLTGDGAAAVRVTAESDGGHVVVHDRSGKPRLEAAMDEDDPVVRLLDETGTRRLSAVVTDRGGFIALRRPSGEPNLMIAGMEGNGPVVACFEEGRPQPAIEMGCTFAPALYIRDRDGAIRLDANVTAEGAVELRLNDGAGVTRGYFGSDAEGHSELALVDAQGARRFDVVVAPDGTPRTGIYAERGVPRLGTRLLADGSPRTSFFDAGGTARLVLETSEGGEPFVTLCDSTAQPRVALQAAAGGEGLYLNEGRELVRGSLSMVQGECVLSLRDRAGNMRCGMKVADGAGEPTLLMRDSGGRDRILHTINEGMGTQPRIQMFGEDEQKVVELMVDFEDRAIMELKDFWGNDCFSLRIGNEGKPTMRFQTQSGDGALLLQVFGDRALIQANGEDVVRRVKGVDPSDPST